ncbi:MAG: glycosyltransferase family 4 protein, partial [Anaerolineales bacterium]|nr:glycosyltransferase family 4 protein [Anaerolineales bacterium]
MRILILTNFYPPYEVGGFEQNCRDVNLRLQAKGHHVAVLTSDHGVPANADRDEPGIYRSLQTQVDFAVKPGAAWQFFRRRPHAERHNEQVFKNVVTQFRPEVIFFWHIEFLPRQITLQAEDFPGVAVAYYLAGFSPAEPDEYWLYWSQPAQKTSIRKLKSVVGGYALAKMRSEGQPLRPKLETVAVVSAYERARGIAAGTLPSDAEVIYNGVEVEQFHNPVKAEINGRLRILQAGRVSAGKGAHLAIEALAQLKQNEGNQNVELVIAGTGPDAYLKQLLELVTAHDLADQVTFTGWLSRTEMPDLMSRCHVLLLPTVHHEPFARVILEGMCSGLAVIASRTGGTEELVQHNVTGLTFDGSSQDLALQMKRLLTEPNLRIQMAKTGQEIVQRDFSLEKMVERLENLLVKAQGKNGQVEDPLLS